MDPTLIERQVEALLFAAAEPLSFNDLARRLDVARGALLLTIDQVDSTADGVAVLVSREHHLADAFSFTVLRDGPGADAEEER